MIILCRELMVNTANVSLIIVEKTQHYVGIKVFLTDSSFNSLGQPITSQQSICLLEKTPENEKKVEEIFNEIFDAFARDQKVFNINRRLL